MLLALLVIIYPVKNKKASARLGELPSWADAVVLPVHQ
jgi:hypothetical protein